MKWTDITVLNYVYRLVQYPLTIVLLTIMRWTQTKSISTSGGSIVPLTLSSTGLPLRTAMFTCVSNLKMAVGVNVAEIRVTPPTGTTPYTGDSVRPGNGLGFTICTVKKNRKVPSKTTAIQDCYFMYRIL